MKNWFIGKNPDARKDWRLEEKGMTGWDGWMAQWTWVWASSRSWWWTGKPVMLWSMGLQRVRHDWAELNWTELNPLAGHCAEDQRGTDMNKLEDEQVTHLMRGLYIKQWGFGRENTQHGDEFLVFTPVFKYFDDFQIGEKLDLFRAVAEEKTTGTYFSSPPKCSVIPVLGSWYEHWHSRNQRTKMDWNGCI